MKKYISAKQLYQILSPHFDIPEDFTDLKISCTINGVCEVDVTYYPPFKEQINMEES